MLQSVQEYRRFPLSKIKILCYTVVERSFEMKKTANPAFQNLQTQDKIDVGGSVITELSARSAGIVVVRRDTHQVLMMRAYNYWDFPKGKIELGERVLEAAVRETAEEAGIRDLNFLWGRAHAQTEPYGAMKKVSYYFLAETRSIRIHMQINPELGKPEHDEYRWVTFTEAKKLAVPRVKKILEWAEGRIKSMTPDYVL